MLKSQPITDVTDRIAEAIRILQKEFFHSAENQMQFRELVHAEAKRKMESFAFVSLPENEEA